VLTLDAAIEQLRAAADPIVETESVPLAEAAGRILAIAIRSNHDVPPADNSAMDGYALRHAVWAGPEQGLPVTRRIPAGRAPGALPAGEAARIFTGAEIPDGADTVVIQEHCREADDTVWIEKLPAAGANIRPRGQDIRQDQEILTPGQRLRPQELGLLASVGLAEVPVRRRLRVAIVSNGDELVEPGNPLAPGQIYNSNRFLLLGLLRDWGFEPVDLGVAPDNPGQLERVFREGAGQADVILSSGGVSVGEEDHVKAVVERLGALSLWKIAMKPGKPLAFGQVAGTPFIGLPGNPASALVTALVVARPFLFERQGRNDVLPRPMPRPVTFEQAGGPRQVFLRVRSGEEGLERYPNQSSGVLLSACWGDGLAVQPPNRDLRVGDTVDYLPYDLLR
jgi:molybdopterin molybdotransferase